MAQSVSRHNSAYRQGLVLGLTMAEVMILVIFVSLITLGWMWKREREQVVALKEQIASHGAPPSPIEARILKQMHELFNLMDAKAEKEIVERLKKPSTTIVVSNEEATFVEKVRKSTATNAKIKIDELWRELTKAADNLDAFRTSMSVTPEVERLLKYQKVTPEQLRYDLQRALNLISKGQHDWPPIITLSDADGYNFNSGSAELSPAFEKRLRDDIIPNLIKLTKQYRVDVIEIIGHTDEQAVGGRQSNLDKALLGFLRGEGSVTDLTPGDNAGLGLARASSIVRVLNGHSGLSNLRILPLSAAQLTLTDQKLTKGSPGDVRERRRIEIRLRRSEQK